jgi:hypothetical protein
MIALDTNLLVYAHRGDSAFHGTAFRVLDNLRHNSIPWAIPWPCIHEFIAVVTRGIYKPASTISDALAFASEVIASPDLNLLSESHGYFEKLRDLATLARVSGGKIHDARIAALCLHHGVKELWSADRDFTAFPQLKVLNPLVTREKY